MIRVKISVLCVFGILFQSRDCFGASYFQSSMLYPTEANGIHNQLSTKWNTGVPYFLFKSMTQTVMDDSRYTPGRSVGVQFDQQVDSPKKDAQATNFSQSVLLLQKLRNFVIAAKNTLLEDNEQENSISEYPRGLRDVKVKKKFKKFLLPLLIAYKLKFLTLIPVLLGGLLLLAGSTGLAGFFFALFAAVMSLKGDGKY